jgi:hypothetical protein
MVRRLPVIQQQDDDPRRPRWHWVVIGIGFVLTIWLPLALAALWMSRRALAWLVGSDDAVVQARFVEQANGADRALIVALSTGLLVLSFAIACWSGGALVGRFGSAGPRDSGLAGALAGLTACVLAAVGGALSPWPVALAALVVLAGGGYGCGLVGGIFGRRKRS